MDIIKSFIGTPIDTKVGVFTSVTWEELLPALSNIVRLRDDEILEGFIATVAGLQIKLSRKKGRKTHKS